MTRRRSLPALFLSLVLMLPFAPSASAALSAGWAAHAAKNLVAVATDGHGNVYVTGSTRTPDEYMVAYLAKFGPGGDKLWSRTWLPRKRFANTWGTGVAVGPDGSVYWVGNVAVCEGDGWFLRSYTPQGRLRWVRDQDGWEHCKVATSASDLAVGAGIVAFSATDHGCCGDPFMDGHVLAFSTDGAFRWNAPFEPPAGVPSGYFDRATGIAIGGLGSVYVGGWAADKKIATDTTSVSGHIVIEKLSAGGSVLWQKNVLASPYSFAAAHVAVRGNQLMVATQSRGHVVDWGDGVPTEAWLGRYSVGGDLVWSRTWGTDWQFAAVPEQLAIDASLDTWVVGTRRDPTDRGLDLFVRRYAPGGGLAGSLRLDGPTRYLHGHGIVTMAEAAAVVGAVGTQKWDDQKFGVVRRIRA